MSKLFSEATKFGKANPGMMGGIGAASEGLFSALGSGTTKQNASLGTISPTLSNFSRKQQTADTVVDKLGSAGLASGNPYAMAAGAVLKGSNVLDKAFKDEDGMYRSKGAAVVANVVNPIALVKNVATGQLFNQGKIRAELHKAKLFQRYDKDYNAISQNAAQGQQIRAGIPEYQAPAYGRKGMKLMSKYSKNC
jgi:hypothetical protein